MIGGGAFTAFADQLIQKLPEGVIGILGEGEDAILKVIEGQSLEQERYILREGKTVRKGQQGSPALLDALTVDLPYLTSIFPQHREYQGESIGVQSKRGCPYDCECIEQGGRALLALSNGLSFPEDVAFVLQ